MEFQVTTILKVQILVLFLLRSCQAGLLLLLQVVLPVVEGANLAAILMSLSRWLPHQPQ